MKGWRKNHVGDYLIRLNVMPVFTKADIELALGFIDEAELYDKNLKVTFTFAPDKHSKDMDGVPQIQVEQLHHIVRTLYSLEHGDELAEE